MGPRKLRELLSWLRSQAAVHHSNAHHLRVVEKYVSTLGEGRGKKTVSKCELLAFYDNVGLAQVEKAIGYTQELNLLPTD
jgi:hypothetical protein